MPWVNVTTGKTLIKEQRAEIAGGVAKVLEEVIQKNPAGVFVSFNTADEFFWGGVSAPEAAMFDVRWIGEFSPQQKSAIAAAILTDLAPQAGIDGSKARVVFTSKVSEDWGRPGS